MSQFYSLNNNNNNNTTNNNNIINNNNMSPVLQVLPVPRGKIAFRGLNGLISYQLEYVEILVSYFSFPSFLFPTSYSTPNGMYRLAFYRFLRLLAMGCLGVEILKVMYLDRVCGRGSVLYSKSVCVQPTFSSEKEITNSKENSQNLPRLSSTVKEKILCSVTTVEMSLLRVRVSPKAILFDRPVKAKFITTGAFTYTR